MSCCAPGLIGDPDALADGGRLRIGEFLRSGRSDGAGRTHYVFMAPAIHCAACIGAIESALLAVPGVASARVNFSSRRVSVAATSGMVDPFDIVRAVERLGYPVTLGSMDGEGARDAVLAELMRCLVVAGFATANVMLLSVSIWAGAVGPTRELFQLVSGLVAVPAVLYAGRPFFRSALGAVRQRRFNMDVPIALGVFLTLANSVYEATMGGGETWFEASVSLIFFLLIGRVLDRIMREKARSGIENLSRIAAKGAMRLDADGTLDFVATEEIEPGMVLQVAAGERFPVDGLLLPGNRTDVDRSFATGESLPASIAGGERIEAGALNIGVPVRMEASADAANSLLSEMMRLMEAAEQGKASYIRLADRASAIYAPVVHLAAAATFAGWIFATGNFSSALSAAVAVLIITCPCALGLAVPVAQVVGAGVLLRRGVLVRTGSAFERMTEAKVAVFDKTGTLTLPRLELEGDRIGDAELRDVAALANFSRHPLSLAVSALARTRALAPRDAEGVSEHPGAGLEGAIGGVRARLGRHDWVLEIAGAPADRPDGDLWFASEGGKLLALKVEAEIRPGAAEAMGVLDRAGLARYLISGDAPSSVATVAHRLGFQEQNVAARVSPTGKAERIAAIAAAAGPVLFVGDGINDAPALGTAHVSITPADASEVGRANADFVFTGQSLAGVAAAYSISKAVLACVRENMALAIGYNIIAVPLAVAGFVTPLHAAIAMSTSSLIVVGNSLRLRLALRGEEPSAARPKRNAHSQVSFG